MRIVRFGCLVGWAGGWPVGRARPPRGRYNKLRPAPLPGKTIVRKMIACFVHVLIHKPHETSYLGGVLEIGAWHAGPGKGPIMGYPMSRPLSDGYDDDDDCSSAQWVRVGAVHRLRQTLAVSASWCFQRDASRDNWCQRPRSGTVEKLDLQSVLATQSACTRAAHVRMPWQQSLKPASRKKRHRGDSNPCRQSPLDFESISLTARTQCHLQFANGISPTLLCWGGVGLVAPDNPD